MGSIIFRDRESNRRERGRSAEWVFSAVLLQSRWTAYMYSAISRRLKSHLSPPPVNGPVQSFCFPALLHFDLYKVLSLPHWFLLCSYLHSPPPLRSKESRTSTYSPQAQIVYCILYAAECIARVTFAVYLHSFSVNKEKISLHFQPHCIPNANRFVIPG